MEGVVYYRRLGDLGDVVNLWRLWEILRDLGDVHFEEICWSWNCCRFTWQVLKSLLNHTSHRVGGLLGVPCGRLDIGSLWGLQKMRETLWFCLVSGLNISIGVLVLCGVYLCRTIRLYVT